MKFTIFANFGPKFRSLRSIEVNALKIVDQNIRKGINIISLVHQCDVTCSSWTLSRHIIQNFLYFSHFWAKSKAYKARKISLPRKINWKVSACICVTSQAWSDDFFRLSWTLSRHFWWNCPIFVIFGPKMRSESPNMQDHTQIRALGSPKVPGTTREMN